MDRNCKSWRKQSNHHKVALRKESVDRNTNPGSTTLTFPVALRKESVDRNCKSWRKQSNHHKVALRKESVDRNSTALASFRACTTSLSARRAWIEIYFASCRYVCRVVALRKESVDRNAAGSWRLVMDSSSLSARRAWIEISRGLAAIKSNAESLSARRAWIEMRMTRRQ